MAHRAGKWEGRYWPTHPMQENKACARWVRRAASSGTDAPNVRADETLHLEAATHEVVTLRRQNTQTCQRAQTTWMGCASDAQQTERACWEGARVGQADAVD